MAWKRSSVRTRLGPPLTKFDKDVPCTYMEHPEDLLQRRMNEMGITHADVCRYANYKGITRTELSEHDYDVVIAHVIGDFMQQSGYTGDMEHLGIDFTNVAVEYHDLVVRAITSPRGRIDRI